MLNHIQKILIIKLRAIGDVILSTIVIPNLRQAFPNAQIDFLTERPAADVVLGNPLLNHVHILELKKIQSLPFKLRWKENRKFIRQIREKKYDLVFDFFGNPRSALLTWLSRGKIRVGYNWRGRQLAYNRVIKSRAATVHEAEFHLDALRALQISIVSRELQFPIDDFSRNFALEFLNRHNLTNTFLVGINCSGGWAAKRWPLERFAQLADGLVAHYQARILILWGPKERLDAQKLASLMKQPITFAPPTALKQSAALINNCKLIISNDSGPMHLAAALKVPTVGIFGPTNPRLQGPYGAIHEIARHETLPCLGCNKVKCDHVSCMLKLPVEVVWQAVQRCIQKNHLIN